MNINIKLFDFLYYDTELPFKRVAELMDISVSTLYVNVTDNYGRALRTPQEAQFIAMRKGRRYCPNPPLPIDWGDSSN